jgi:predicted MPP superfamily phosphohydrolase
MPANPFRILHLSDLHLARDHEWDSADVLKGATKAIVAFREKGLAPDLVALTGDLANTGKPDDYDRVRQWMDKTLLNDGLRIDASQIVIVPGNHDVDRSLVQGGAVKIQDRLLEQSTEESIAEVLKSPIDRAVLFARHAAYVDFLEKIYGSRNDSLWFSRIYQHGSHRIHVAGLCSSWMSHRKQDKGALLVGRYQLAQIADDADGASISIALIHHPIDYLPDFDKQHVSRAFEQTYRIVLRGHLHDQQSLNHASPDAAYLEFACGALYSGGSFPNAFQLIEIDLERELCRAHYRVWQNGEWIVDRNRYQQAPNGIATISLSRHPGSVPPAGEVAPIVRPRTVGEISSPGGRAADTRAHDEDAPREQPRGTANQALTDSPRMKLIHRGVTFLVLAIACLWVFGIWPFRRTCLSSATTKKLASHGFEVSTSGSAVEITGRDLQLRDLSEIGPMLRNARCPISLVLDNCDQLTRLDGLSDAPLSEVHAISCDRIVRLWEPGALPGLVTLNLSQSKALSELDGCSNLLQLELIDATECQNLRSISALSNLPHLERVLLTNCRNLTTLTVEGELGRLDHLEVNGCSQLRSLDGLRKMPSLKYLDISGCASLKSLASMPRLYRLETVVMCDNAELSNVDALKDLPALKKVYVGSNPKLAALVRAAASKAEISQSCLESARADTGARYTLIVCSATQR